MPRAGMAGENAEGLSLKELILRLETKFDTYILAHEKRHQDAVVAMQMAATDPQASPAGKILSAQIETLGARTKSLEDKFDGLDDSIQVKSAVEADRAMNRQRRREYRQFEWSRLASFVGWAITLGLFAWTALHPH